MGREQGRGGEGRSSYDGDLSLPLGLALGSPIFPSGCEGKLGIALESLQGLQYYCLENPRDRGAWWAVVYGVAQSQTRLK